MTTTTFTNIASELATLAQKLQNITVKVRSGSLGTGSGVIWQSSHTPSISPTSRGETGSSIIITNAHVATSNNNLVELADGRVFDAVRTHFDPQRDLAALKINATNLPTATIGNSDALRVGELVLAVGNPFTDTGAVTTGIIHTNNQRMLMADIRLFPGNSGGLLADCLGRVVGINTMIAYGLAVAIPTSSVANFLHGQSRPQLGLSVQPIVLPNQRRLGLLVLSVHSGSAAETAGLQVGDVLIGAAGRLFTKPNDLASYLYQINDTEVLPLQVLRGKQQLVCYVTLQSLAQKEIA